MEVFERLIHTLRERGLHISAAESCTAGLFSSKLAEIPGASDVLEYGFVTYSQEAKKRMVGVKPQTLRRNGVVSEPTAKEMAHGAAEYANCEVGVGITGYAGPSSDEGYPVGRVCFGVYLFGETYAQTVEFGDIGRNAVREQSAVFAAEYILQLLEARR